MIIGSSPIIPICIAQLVEQWSLKPEVLGSSPNTPIKTLRLMVGR